MRGTRRKLRRNEIRRGLMRDLGLMGRMGEIGLVVVDSLAVDWVAVWVVA